MVVRYARVGSVYMGVRHTIGNAATMVDDVGVVIFGILVRRLSTGVTIDNNKLLI